MTIITRTPNGARHNQILGALAAEAFARIEPHLELAPFKLADVICEAGSTIRHAYFPEGCVLSLLTPLEDGSAIETANIGREGAFGLFSAMYSRTSFNRCVVQLEGRLLRCKIEILHYEFKNNENVQDLFVSYSETLLAQVQQSVACSARHSVHEKLSRWLLQMADRCDGQPMAYTHEFISQILGVNRKSITMAAQAMQSAGLIQYHRGTMQVLNHLILEQASCECYGIVKARFDEFLKPSLYAMQDTVQSSGKRIN